MRLKHLGTSVFFFLILCFMVFPSTAVADPVTIDFDSLSDSDLVTNQFAGLSFSNAAVASAGISLNEFEFPPRSGSNVVFDSGGAISISFATPVTSVGGYITYTVPITLTAFDASDNVLGSITSLFSSNLAISGDPGSSPNEFISFSFVGGISRILITGDALGSSFTLDDLTVDSVPEPTTLVLLGIGLGGLALKQQKRKS